MASSFKASHDIGHLKTMLLKQLSSTTRSDQLSSTTQSSNSSNQSDHLLSLNSCIDSMVRSNLFTKPAVILHFLHLVSKQAKQQSTSANNGSTMFLGGLLDYQSQKQLDYQSQKQPSTAEKKSQLPLNVAPAAEAHYTDSLFKERASVFNSFYTPHHVLAGGYTLVSEADLVRDLLFVFQGIDGAFIQYTQTPPPPPKTSGFKKTCTSAPQGGFVLRGDIKIPRPTREMVQKLCLLGWVYSQIVSLLEERNDAGLFGQALVSTVNAELQDYKRLVCVLEGHLDTHKQKTPGFVSQDLSLKRLFVWTRGPLFRLSVLLALLQVTRNKTGGCLLSAIHLYVNHGDAGLNAYTRKLISDISKPFYNMLSQWMEHGVVDDPYHEFFCISDAQLSVPSSSAISSKTSSVGGEYWKQKFTFVADMVPCFIDLQVAKKAFLIGKSLDFVRNVMGDYGYSWSLQSIKLEYSGLNELALSIDATYQKVSTYLLNVMYQKYDLFGHLGVIKGYLLLGQGDFVGYLMDSLNDTLDKPANTIYRHNLVGVLESAVRINSGSITCQDLLARLDVCLLEGVGGETGWEVFTLDYRITAPLDTIFSPPSMRIYQKVFTFLWRLKRVDKILMEGYKNFKRHHHSTHLLRQTMIHFTSVLTRHCFQAVDLEYNQLTQSLENTDTIDLDSVVSSHRAFLLGLTQKVMFAGGDQSLFVSILSILTCIVSFEKVVCDALNMEEEILVVQESKSSFDGRVGLLLKALHEQGYGDLAAKLDFNEVF